MFENIIEKIDAMAHELADRNYEGKHDSIIRIIDEAREELARAKGELGPWEAEELDYAEQAVRHNFLMLALTATDKALNVSQLPADEYKYGFSYTKRKR